MVNDARLSRRQFLRLGCRTLAGGLLLTALPSLYSVFAEPRWLQVVRTPVRVPNLPTSLRGLRIGQLSDLHVSSEADVDLVEEAVRLLNGESPDLVALTGDFVTGDAAYSAMAAEALMGLRAPHGVYAVLGNHDVWTDPDNVAVSLEEIGIHVLRDDGLRLMIAGAPLWLLGIEDRGHTGFSTLHQAGDFKAFQEGWQDADDVVRALLEEIPPKDARLLLVHNPDFVEMLPSGRVDLALSGHTHGGQVRVPFVGAVFIPSCFGQTFVSGLVQGTRTQVYVSRGVGEVPPAVRFNCRPEVTVVQLKVS